MSDFNWDETPDEAFARENAARLLASRGGLSGLGALDVSGAANLIMGATGNLITGAVRKVTIKTQIAPTVSYTPGAPGEPARAQSEGFGAEAVLALIKPEIEMETPAGVVRMAPYGTPSPGKWFWPVVGAFLLGSTVLVTLAARGVVSIMRREGS